MDIYYQLCMDKSIVFVWVKLVCRCKWTVLCSWNLFIVCSWNLLIMSFSKLSYRFLINFKIFCPHLSIFYILEFGVIRFRLLRCLILTKQKLIRVKTVRRVSDFFYPYMWPLESRCISALDRSQIECPKCRSKLLSMCQIHQWQYKKKLSTEIGQGRDYFAGAELQRTIFY
jgi:hypothetical protein